MSTRGLCCAFPKGPAGGSSCPKMPSKPLRRDPKAVRRVDARPEINAAPGPKFGYMCCCCLYAQDDTRPSTTTRSPRAAQATGSPAGATAKAGSAHTLGARARLASRPAGRDACQPAARRGARRRRATQGPRRPWPSLPEWVERHGDDLGPAGLAARNGAIVIPRPPSQSRSRARAIAGQSGCEGGLRRFHACHATRPASASRRSSSGVTSATTPAAVPAVGQAAVCARAHSAGAPRSATSVIAGRNIHGLSCRTGRNARPPVFQSGLV